MLLLSAPRVSSIIQDENCSPPCWEQISPGITTRDEVKPLLEQISWVQRDSIQDAYTVSPGDSIKWMGSFTSADSSGRIFFDNDIVTLIEINPKKNVLSFSDVIDEFGEPENILILRVKGERSTVTVFLLYPTKGIGFIDYYFTPIDLGETVQITPDEGLKSAWYGKVDEFYDYLLQGQVGRLQ